MPKYQIQYKNNSQTFTETLEANSHIEIIDFFQTVVNAEITEIREIVFENPIYPKDDGLYKKNVTALLTDNDTSLFSLKLPKVKKSMNSDILTNLIKKHIKLNGKIPLNIKISGLF